MTIFIAPNMEQIIQSLRSIPADRISFEEMGRVLYQTDPASYPYAEHLPEKVTTGYSRKIVTLDPIECLVLYWSPGAASAVHFHEGFWGYVAVVRGICQNVEYAMKDGILRETSITTVHAGGIVPEQDNIIHTIRNGSETQPLITVHFYHPALVNLDGLQIYDLANGRIGILNDQAASASWDEPVSSFSRITDHAFSYDTSGDDEPASHIIRPLIPKPDATTISNMLEAYYDDQATMYDYLDQAYASRKLYIEGINSRIAGHLQQAGNVDRLLAMACGTGRRATEIRTLSGQDYQIIGVDLSKEMVEQAKDRDLEIMHASWNDFELHLSGKFDILTTLYAFGHLSCHEVRVDYLRRLLRLAKQGALLFVDVFNLDDQTEWGPLIREMHRKLHLKHFNYESGDVFYSRNRHDHLAYLHYFTETEIRKLVAESGWKIRSLEYVGYSNHPGETSSSDSGNIFLVLEA